jgi:hypothetical protein
MKPADKEWREFCIKDIFIIENKKKVQVPTGAYIHKNALLSYTTPRITVTSDNNGINNFSKSNHKNYRTYKNFISVSFLVTVFYHPYEASIDMKVHCLQIKDRKLNPHIGKFLITEIKKSIENASYGNQISSTDLPNKKIILPINEEDKPDWQFMENYAKYIFKDKKLKYKDYITKSLNKLNYKELVKLQEKKWQEFFIGGQNGIFEISSSYSGIDKNKLLPSKGKIYIPYITRTEYSNGINLFVSKKQEDKYNTDKGNAITIGLDTQTVFYQPHKFYTGQNIQVLRQKKLNSTIAQFLIPLIKVQMQKFNWGGNGATLGRLVKTKIMLPIDRNHKPDYEYMEQYIENLKYKKIQQYLSYSKSL